MTFKPLGWMAVALLLGACGSDQPATTTAPPPQVRTIAIDGRDNGELHLSATLRARYETPLAFQVGGRIASRARDAGQTAALGDTLFALDPRDLDQALNAASAERDAASVAVATAEAELARARGLVERKFLSTQALERTELQLREARTRLASATSRLEQARNNRHYAQLTAPATGLLTDVSGEPGQVVAPGQVVGRLAHDGPREVEVFLPDQGEVPARGSLALPDGATRALAVREVAGAVDAGSRTRRVRYRVEGGDPGLALGSVLRVTLAGAGAGALASAIDVPIGALDERGGGPRVWRVQEDGAAVSVNPVAVEVIALQPESARIRANLPPGSRIVALGTHLLQPGMAVRELGR